MSGMKVSRCNAARSLQSGLRKPPVLRLGGFRAAG